jgi:hypothetical protein
MVDTKLWQDLNKAAKSIQVWSDDDEDDEMYGFGDCSTTSSLNSIAAYSTTYSSEEEQSKESSTPDAGDITPPAAHVDMPCPSSPLAHATPSLQEKLQDLIKKLDVSYESEKPKKIDYDGLSQHKSQQAPIKKIEVCKFDNKGKTQQEKLQDLIKKLDMPLTPKPKSEVLFQVTIRCSQQETLQDFIKKLELPLTPKPKIEVQSQVCKFDTEGQTQQVKLQNLIKQLATPLPSNSDADGPSQALDHVPRAPPGLEPPPSVKPDMSSESVPPPPEPPPSLGSLGHPYTCANACKYVKRKTGCRDGSACPHCHLCFWRHRARPSGLKGLCVEAYSGKGDALAEKEEEQARIQTRKSAGSVGHPHNCAEACKYFNRKGGCRNGTACTKCHMCEWRRKPSTTPAPMWGLSDEIVPGYKRSSRKRLQRLIHLALK